ncbi:MAG: zinc-ribbon domain-containing protein [Candidatus Heimdallarchaeota archaeon]|nr:MAG: zinc-ribbon domain-containing protein [Candidatus Heimdallarchaeota archaeon]
MSHTYCTNCGKEISITARFCRFCGSPVKKSRSTAPSPEPVSPPLSAPPAPMREPVIAPSEVTEKIPNDIIELLYSRKRKDQIKAELKKLLDQIDELTKKVEIGLITEDESTQKIEEIQSNITTLQEEKKVLQTQPLALETLVEDEKLWHKRLEKIEEKKRAQVVSSDVYTSLRDEYSSELAVVQQKLAVEERKARRWLVDLQKDSRELEAKVEQIRVRGEIEGLSKEEITKKTEDLTLQRVKKSTASEVLTQILGSL